MGGFHSGSAGARLPSPHSAGPAGAGGASSGPRALSSPASEGLSGFSRAPGSERMPLRATIRYRFLRFSL